MLIDDWLQRPCQQMLFRPIRLNGNATEYMYIGTQRENNTINQVNLPCCHLGILIHIMSSGEAYGDTGYTASPKNSPSLSF